MLLKFTERELSEPESLPVMMRQLAKMIGASDPHGKRHQVLVALYLAYDTQALEMLSKQDLVHEMLEALQGVYLHDGQLRVATLMLDLSKDQVWQTLHDHVKKTCGNRYSDLVKDALELRSLVSYLGSWSSMCYRIDTNSVSRETVANALRYQLGKKK